MRRAFLTIMIFVYLSAASGMSVNMHYCMDQLVSWSLSGDRAQDCPACDENKKSAANHQFSCKGCCKDELKQVMVEKNHKVEQSVPVKFSAEDLTSTAALDELSFVLPVKLIGLYNINAPPASEI